MQVGFKLNLSLRYKYQKVFQPNNRIMKKLLLLTLSILFVSALTARPVILQHLLTDSKYTIGTDTLELYDTLGNKINNGTLKISGSNPSVDALVGYIYLKNTTTTEMQNVYVRRIINQEVANTTNSFCFGINCYPPWVGQSVTADTVKVGIIDKSFYADYYPAEHGGLTSITYEFFDDITFGKPVTAKATIEFAISAAGIGDEKLIFKGPYPNPASQSANFEYNLPPAYHSAQLIIRNMLGNEVERIMFENGTGRKSIDVSTYASGLYFYSFEVDGKTVSSNKLIVKH